MGSSMYRQDFRSPWSVPGNWFCRTGLVNLARFLKVPAVYGSFETPRGPLPPSDVHRLWLCSINVAECLAA